MAVQPEADDRLNVVLCWHMHQPDYRLDGVWQRPWTWLHALKDYTDMAAHLERTPEARAVVNFSAVLLHQLRDLTAALAESAGAGAPAGDPLLDALAGSAPADEAGLQRALLRVHPDTMAARFPAYRELAERARDALARGDLLPAAERDDLLVWYTLCWLGESLRGDARAARLQGRAGGFTAADLRTLRELVAECVSGVLPRYRALADSGRIELSVTPYSHPMLPLLLDFAVAAEALPDVPLPAVSYPGGAARCDWQLTEARRVFRAAFGRAPDGCWPSEGGLSEATLEILGEHGFTWTASGNRVLRNSLGGEDGAPHLRVWQPARGPVCVFRDDALSDRIGFVYATWSPAGAVADFVQRIEALPVPCDEPAVLAIIMDGENAWEYYPENGWNFLQALYRALAGHPRFNLTTFAAALGRLHPRPLPRLVAGSWVHGTFSTWIGNAARNRAWSLLVASKQAVDRALAESGRETDPEWLARVDRQLALCEASDWFWWLDPDNTHPDVADFDALYRAQLAALYRLINRQPPATLGEPLLRAVAAHADLPVDATGEGAMRRSSEEGGAA